MEDRSGRVKDERGDRVDMMAWTWTWARTRTRTLDCGLCGQAKPTPKARGEAKGS